MAIVQGLVDYLGRPIQKAELTRRLEGPTLSGVRTPLTGYPSQGLTPVTLDSILKEADQGFPLRFYELAEQIEEKDHHYSAVLGTRKRSVAQIPITVEPAGDDAKSLEQAKMIQDWLDRDELSDETIDILDAIGKGESFTQIEWDTSSGDWRPLRLTRWDQRWFRPLRQDLTTPMLIGENGDIREVPPGAFIHLVARGKSGIPARSGLARLGAWFWLFKSMTARDWAVYSATFGIPLRVGKYGPNATEDDKDTLFRAVANIAGDCAAIIPASMTIEFVSPQAASTGTSLYKDRADWLDQQMSKAALGQTTTTDAISGGHAVSQEHQLVREDIERADAKVLQAALNRDLVRVWIDLQYGPQKAYPRIVIDRPEQEDLTLLATAVPALVDVGLRVGQAEIRSKFGLSEPDADEAVLSPRALTAPPGAIAPIAIGSPAPATAAAPASRTLHAEQDETEDVAVNRAIDALGDETGVLAAQSMDEVLNFIGSIVNESGSLEEVRSKLLKLSPNMPTKSLAMALRQAQVVARLSGRASVMQDG